MNLSIISLSILITLSLLTLTLIIISHFKSVKKEKEDIEKIQTKEDPVLIYENDLFKRKIFIELLTNLKVDFKVAEDKMEINNIIIDNNIKIAFFSENIDKEILTSLKKIEDLRLIGLYQKGTALTDLLFKGFDDGLESPVINKLLVRTKIYG